MDRRISGTPARCRGREEWLIGDIVKNGAATTQEAAQQRPVPEFEVGA